MFVKSQDGAVVLNNDKVTEYSTDSKYDGRYKVAALVGENRVCLLYTSPSPRDRG